jgi:serine/threonine protein phosphatase PrpC
MKMRRSLLSALTPVLRPAGIAIGFLTFIAEVILLVLLYLNQMLNSRRDLLFLIIGAIVCLANLLAWLRPIRLDPQTIEQKPLQIDEAQKQKLTPVGPGQTQPVANTRCYAYTVPKESLELRFSQDKYRWLINQECCRFAVADGVGGSFLPSKWAEIIVENFVNLSEDFNTQQKFDEWLSLCSQQWGKWADTEWIPRIQQQRSSSYDWSADRQRGAETTLIGCSFSPVVLTQAGHTNILVTAVGDAVFFLIRPPATGDQQWQHTVFALDNPKDFDSTPQTLLSVETDTRQAWHQVKRQIFPAYRGDYIFLTTDALAKWILLEIEQSKNPWKKLLDLANQKDFFTFVAEERNRHSLELDDTTLMVVAIA